MNAMECKGLWGNMGKINRQESCRSGGVRGMGRRGTQTGPGAGGVGRWKVGMHVPDVDRLLYI